MGRKVTCLVPSVLSYLSQNCYSAYLLAAAALSPVYGKISDIVGRKAVFYPIVVIFLVRAQRYLQRDDLTKRVLLL